MVMLFNVSSTLGSVHELTHSFPTVLFSVLLRCGGEPRLRRRPLGGGGEPLWPRHRDGDDGAVRPDPAGAGRGRPAAGAAGGAGRPVDRQSTRLNSSH